MTTTSTHDPTVGSITLTDLPPPILCFDICPFLDLQDLMILRVASRIVHGSFHNEHDISNKMWKIMLQRDFGLPFTMWQDVGRDSQGQEFFFTVPSQQESGVSTLSLEPEGMVVAVKCGFEAAKAWMRVSSSFYAGADASTTRTMVHAPYFLRAARFWQSICRWCNEADPEGPASTMARLEIYQSLAPTGLKYIDWPEESRGRRHSMHASQAIYAFCSYGKFLGGFRIIPPLSSHLDFVPPSPVRSPVPVSEAVTFPAPRHLMLAQSHILYGIIINTDTGSLEAISFVLLRGNIVKIVPAVFLPSEGHTSGGVDGAVDAVAIDNRPEHILLWLEEHARRLTTGEIGIGRLPIGSLPIANVHNIERSAIILNPRYVPWLVEPFHQPPIVSRRLTRGIEVTITSVYIGHLHHDGEFLSSIRIRLLSPGDEGYISRNERGFLQCQLSEQNSRIINRQTAFTLMWTDHWNGLILREGGYFTDTGAHDGVFESQSMFTLLGGGELDVHLIFVADPWHRRETFRVEVGVIALDPRPEYVY